MKPIAVAGKKYLAPTPDQMHQLVVDLALKINQKISSGEIIKPEMVVAFGRGGWSWLKELADWLNISPLSTFRVVHYKGIGVRLKEPIVLQSLSTEVINKKILLFDDVVETGKTFCCGIDYLILRGAKKISSATIFLKNNSPFKPDFYAAKTGAWVIFPNEIVETVKFLGSQWLEKGVDLAAIKKRFYTIGLNQQEVNWAMKIIFNFTEQ